MRKLVADLQNEINGDTELSNTQKKDIAISTLHKFARRVVEQNHGTTEWRFKYHFRIIGQPWKHVVWGDVFSFFEKLDKSFYTWEKFEEQLYNNDFDKSME